MNFAERMRYVRELFGCSARKLSLDLGIAPNMWGVYESGASQPGLNILIKLGERGVNLNWLIMGSGDPQGSEQAVIQNMNSALAYMDSATQEELDLGHLALLAHQSQKKLHLSIVTELERFANGCTLEQLQERIGARPLDIASALCSMVQDGVARVSIEDGKELYLAVSGMTGKAKSRVDIAAMCMNSLQFIARDIHAGLVGDADTYLIHGVAVVGDGKQFINTIKKQIMSAADESFEGQRVNLVFAAKVEK